MKYEKCNGEIVKVAFNCDLWDDMELWDCFCRCGHKLISFEAECNSGIEINEDNEGGNINENNDYRLSRTAW